MPNDNDKHVELDGIVKECVRGVITVELSSGQTVLTTLSGKMKMNKINVIPGDKVYIKVSPYDTTRGFIYKLIKGKALYDGSSGRK
jgi:translation initiation factor IF-1